MPLLERQGSLDAIQHVVLVTLARTRRLGHACQSHRTHMQSLQWSNVNGRSWCRQKPRRDGDQLNKSKHRAAIMAVLAGVAFLMAACGGARPASGNKLANLAVELDTYASCVRSHGVRNFYITKMGSSPPPPSQALEIWHGLVIPPDPSLSAQKACRHLLPHGTPPSVAEQHQGFLQALKAARCMRFHGYPSWPDPPEGSLPVVPADIDTSSPQFQTTARTCGVAP